VGILLRTLQKGNIVMVDKLISHNVADVKKAIESVGAKLVYLPPYSPDSHPIELVFSKLNTLVRKAKLRKVDKLWKNWENSATSSCPKNAKISFDTPETRTSRPIRKTA
jgi:transposase